MRKIKPTLFVFFLFLCQFVQAQAVSRFDSTMRSSGRIYVVIAVMLTILTGIVIYLVRLDRKLRRLEKETN